VEIAFHQPVSGERVGVGVEGAWVMFTFHASGVVLIDTRYADRLMLRQMHNMKPTINTFLFVKELIFFIM
jgi:hypothetical protein